MNGLYLSLGIIVFCAIAVIAFYYFKKKDADSDEHTAETNEPEATAEPETHPLNPNWEFLFQDLVPLCAADVRSAAKYYLDTETGEYYATDIYGNNPVQVTEEHVQKARLRE